MAAALPAIDKQAFAKLEDASSSGNEAVCRTILANYSVSVMWRYSFLKKALMRATMSEDGSAEMRDAIECARLLARDEMAWINEPYGMMINARGLIHELIGGMCLWWKDYATQPWPNIARFVRLVYGLASELEHFNDVDFHHEFICRRLLETHQHRSCLPALLTDPLIVDMFRDLCSAHPPFCAARDRFLATVHTIMPSLSLDTACMLMMTDWMPTNIFNMNNVLLKACHAPIKIVSITASHIVRLSERLATGTIKPLALAITIPRDGVGHGGTNVWISVLRAIMSFPIAVGKPILANYLACKEAYGVDLGGAIESIIYSPTPFKYSTMLAHPYTALELEIAATYLETHRTKPTDFQDARRMFRLSDLATARRFLGVLRSISRDSLAAVHGLMAYSPIMSMPSLHILMWTHPLAATHTTHIVAQHYRILHQHADDLALWKDYARHNLRSVQKLSAVITTLGGTNMRKLWHWPLPTRAVHAIVDFAAEEGRNGDPMNLSRIESSRIR